MCECGHGSSQHHTTEDSPKRRVCDYRGHSCQCKGYRKGVTVIALSGAELIADLQSGQDDDGNIPWDILPDEMAAFLRGE